MNNTEVPLQEEKEESMKLTKQGRLTKVKEGLKKLPEKKAHLDFVAALLTIPVLLSVIFINLSNISKKDTSVTKTTPTPAISTPPSISSKQPIIIQASSPTTAPATTNTACIKDIGPIDISTPAQGATVTDNPVAINIDYQQGNYCSSVWSYSINGSSWSDYSNNAPVLYNLPQGQNTFNLRIKSLASSSTKTLQRSFTYKGSSGVVTPSQTPQQTPTPIASQSATTN